MYNETSRHHPGLSYIRRYRYDGLYTVSNVSYVATCTPDPDTHFNISLAWKTVPTALRSANLIFRCVVVFFCPGDLQSTDPTQRLPDQDPLPNPDEPGFDYPTDIEIRRMMFIEARKQQARAGSGEASGSQDRPTGVDATTEDDEEDDPL